MADAATLPLLLLVKVSDVLRVGSMSLRNGDNIPKTDTAGNDGSAVGAFSPLGACFKHSSPVLAVFRVLVSARKNRSLQQKKSHDVMTEIRKDVLLKLRVRRPYSIVCDSSTIITYV